jgi:hypothetical protein
VIHPVIYLGLTRVCWLALCPRMQSRTMLMTPMATLAILRVKIQFMWHSVDLSLCRIGQAISTQFWLPTHCALGATSIKDFIRPNRFMPSSEWLPCLKK